MSGMEGCSQRSRNSRLEAQICSLSFAVFFAHESPVILAPVIVMLLSSLKIFILSPKGPPVRGRMHLENIFWEITLSHSWAKQSKSVHRSFD